MHTDTGPSRGWYWLAGAVGLASLAAAIVLGIHGYTSFRDAVDRYPRVPTPGTGVVVIDDPGTYTLFWEPLYGPTRTPPFTDVRVRPVLTGTDLPLRPYDGEETYEVGGHAGSAFLKVSLLPGRYRITTRAEPGVLSQGEIAVGKDALWRVFVGIGVAFGALAAGMLIAGPIVAVTAIRRHRAHWPRPSRTPAATARAAGAPPPPPAPTAPPPPPPAPGAQA